MSSEKMGRGSVSKKDVEIGTWRVHIGKSWNTLTYFNTTRKKALSRAKEVTKNLGVSNLYPVMINPKKG